MKEMSRRKVIMIAPHLNDYAGNLNRNWYVEWAYRMPGHERLIRQRKYGWQKIEDEKKRNSEIKKFIAKKWKELESGKHLCPDKATVIYEDQLEYSNAARLYGRKKQSVITIRTYLSEYLAHKKTVVNEKSYQTYQSKMRHFCAFIDGQKLTATDVSNLDTAIITQFLTGISAELSRASVAKYQQQLYNLFDWLIRVKKVISYNPVDNVPKRLGRVVDCAPSPIHRDDRDKLKDVICRREPYLWLACEIQYYCAIRPGTEVRLMRVGMIDFTRGIITVPAELAKNDRSEMVAIPNQLLEDMHNVYRLDTYDKELFVFGKGGIPGPEPNGKNFLRNRFNYWRDELRLSKAYKFYSWKHTGAIEASENGMSIYDLRDHLRHKSIGTTEEYLKKRKPQTSKFVKNNFPSI